MRGGAFQSVYGCVDGWMYEEDNVSDYAGRVARVVEGGMGVRRVARRVAVGGFSVESAVRDVVKAYLECCNGTEEAKVMKKEC